MTAQVMAVPSLAGDEVGLIVYWRLSGTTDREVLLQALSREGLEALAPRAVSQATALRRASMEQVDRSLLVRGIRGGYAFVRESVVDAEGIPECRYDQVASVRLAEGGVLKAHGDGGITAQVTLATERHLQSLSQEDISSWLAGPVVGRVGAVRLRDTGGIYFVPRTERPTWDQIVRAVRSCTHHLVHEIPAVRSDEAIDAVMDAVIRESAQVSRDAEAAVANTDLGSRALKTRADAVQTMRHKVLSYEQLLGRKMDQVTRQLGDLRSTLVEASLAASGREVLERKATP